MIVIYRRMVLLSIIFIFLSSSAYSSSTPMVDISISFDRANLPMVEMVIDKQNVKFYLDTGAKAVSGHVDCGEEMIDLQFIRMPLPDQFKPVGVIGYDFFSRCALYLKKNHDTMKIACTKG